MFYNSVNKDNSPLICFLRGDAIFGPFQNMEEVVTWRICIPSRFWLSRNEVGPKAGFDHVIIKFEENFGQTKTEIAYASFP